MSRRNMISHEFVEFIPDELADGTVYISIPYATATHLCCCGCGFRVVTPLNLAKWKLIFEGSVISLHPSIGNWSSECQSHYWIRRNEVVWARKWSRQEIDAGRRRDQLDMDSFVNQRSTREAEDSELGLVKGPGLLARFLARFRSR